MGTRGTLTTLSRSCTSTMASKGRRECPRGADRRVQAGRGSSRRHRNSARCLRRGLPVARRGAPRRRLSARPAQRRTGRRPTTRRRPTAGGRQGRTTARLHLTWIPTTTTQAHMAHLRRCSVPDRQFWARAWFPMVASHPIRHTDQDFPTDRRRGAILRRWPWTQAWATSCCTGSMASDAMATTPGTTTTDPTSMGRRRTRGCPRAAPGAAGCRRRWALGGSMPVDTQGRRHMVTRAWASTPT
mmetsp:Transcript_79054/g.229588  ORF Transcript_79054/g.229588 Transcript_79054/m.229588 type:complete len:243 (+) Transcript_79054:1301-2029(+)